MQALGVPTETVDALRDEEDEDPEGLPVYLCNWKTVQAFRRLSRSWEVEIFMGGSIYLGLRPEACESVLRLMQIPDSEQLEMLDALRVMEDAALEILNERQ